jgi:GNAT superfamily N-acetyltransferase
VQVTRTYLVMERPGQLRPGDAPSVRARLERVDPCGVAEWRELYRAIGSAWRWHDRDAWSDEQLAAHLQRADVRVYRADVLLETTVPDSTEVRGAGFDELRGANVAELRGAGFVELERHAGGDVEIVYLGLDRRAFGVGLGRWIVTRAVEEAWAMGATRVWLHTCTLDAPSALPNYLSRGFVVDRTEEYLLEP